MKKVAVVTGGAGFIGSHLCRFLLGKGFRVVCVDNLLTGSRGNVADLEASSDFSFVSHDVSDPLELPGAVHYIFHLASPASPVDYMRYPIQTLKVGALGTHNLLGLAKAKKAVFLLASTSEVYGDPLVHPQPESYWGNVNPVGPRGVYDEAKRFAEAMTMAYRRVHGVDAKIARIFNSYGSNMRRDDGRVVPAFITQAISGKPLTVFGDGSQTRSFCFVSDMVEGIYKLMLSKVNEPVNLGNPEELTVLQFANRILALTGSRSKVVFRPLPVDDPKTRCPDISLARKLLKWQPKVGVDDGLRQAIDWFREN